VNGASQSAPRWFSEARPRTEDEERFLTRLRERASAWQVPGLSPDASYCDDGLVPLVAMVDHPILVSEGYQASVQVGYWPIGSKGLVRLEGELGFDLLLDGPLDDYDLLIQGVWGEPEFFADAAATWIQQELRRPLERLEWLDGQRVAASRIRLADSGQKLVRRGSWLRTRRAPDRTSRLN